MVVVVVVGGGGGRIGRGLKTKKSLLNSSCLCLGYMKCCAALTDIPLVITK